jgi:hypothetical protein
MRFLLYSGREAARSCAPVSNLVLLSERDEDDGSRISFLRTIALDASNVLALAHVDVPYALVFASTHMFFLCALIMDGFPSY